MKFSLQALLAVLALSILAHPVLSQQVVLSQSNASGIYKAGESIKVSVQVRGAEADSIQIKMNRNYSNSASWQTIPTPVGKKVLFEGSFSKPASGVFHVRIGDEISTSGFIVEPDQIKPVTQRPKDFDAYWKAQKKALRDLPMEIESEWIDHIEAGFVCSDVELNCIGPKPARGYFAKPANADPATLPIVLYVHAAGVNGDWCLSKASTAIQYAKKGKGALAFDLNAHGMLNGQAQEYYDDLQEGELKNYWEIGAENLEKNYFRGMYLRLQRTLDFLCAQPEWDGKRIIIIGESQGGGQALAAAGMDDRVTAVVATVPAMCDFGRTLIGETGGWPNPYSFEKDREKMLDTYPYFDVAHLLKGCKATLVTEIGLIDYTCPAFGIYAAINQAKGKKLTLVTPYRSHHLDQKEFQKQWEEKIYKPKMEFINAFLR
ncbi:acetylxylan esterase [Maribellus mangrovi]|uniref:acetylxylan esterase n=1 Tax=Maribellus mangrovi TaxID=3133146 RepID=UPI0030EB237A